MTDICAWLSELSNQYCDCAECRKAGVGQYALETRAIVKAYRLVQKKHPDLGLRILLTQGSYKSNDKVLTEIPADVGVTYYDGGRTYDSSRDPMIYPLLEQYTPRKAAGWLLPSTDGLMAYRVPLERSAVHSVPHAGVRTEEAEVLVWLRHAGQPAL